MFVRWPWWLPHTESSSVLCHPTVRAEGACITVLTQTRDCTRRRDAGVAGGSGMGVSERRWVSGAGAFASASEVPYNGPAPCTGAAYKKVSNG